MVYLIKEHEWKSILLILRHQENLYCISELALRHFIEAVVYVTRSGCQWRLLPSCYGSWNSVYKRFKRWQQKGVWERVLQLCQKDPDTEHVMVDATIIRAHACSAGYEKEGNAKHALGRSKGGFTTKVHALCDGLGNPLKFILTPGQRADITQGDELIKGIESTTVLADKGYDSNAFVKTIEEQGCAAVIPPRRNRKIKRDYDEHIYKERHLIECLFGKMKHFRRVFSRFDKDVSSFMAFLNIVGTLIWLR
jgi:transposase